MIIEYMEEREKAPGSAAARREPIPRAVHGQFTYPYGVYPEDPFAQKEGYDSRYLKNEGCFYYEVIVSHEKIMETFFSLSQLLPENVFIVTKIHSNDYYRDHDTYISEDLVPRKDAESWVADWQDVALDDGFFGVGFFAEGETVEVFLDDHKTIHVYHNNPDMVEATLERLGIPFEMDLKFFWDLPHYHEPLPLNEEYGDDFLTAFEDMADLYELYLDEEEEENIDSEGTPLGVTCWKVEVRGYAPPKKGVEAAKGFYSTIYVNANSRKEVVELIDEHLASKEEQVDLYLQMARVPVELLTSDMRKLNADPDEPCVWFESERVAFDWDQS
ncbi:MAG: hypothetical protein HZB29_05785 [Nitrospinae bacterium]|nr:hypothetical protein [Nitrospinota bacterium]